MTERVCAKCKAAPAQAKPTKAGTMWRSSYCEPCDKERKRTAYVAKQDELRARQRRYRERRLATPTTVACPRCGAEHTARGADNWCPDCRRAYHRERRADPAKKPRINAKQREWYQTNRERERELRRKYRDDIKGEAIAAYGGICACCGERHLEFLAIHHINGNGKQHRIQASGVGGQFYRWLKRQGWPQDPPLGVLCHNCNVSDGLYGYCPHEHERVESDNSDEI